jgi:hypothetical protein
VQFKHDFVIVTVAGHVIPHQGTGVSLSQVVHVFASGHVDLLLQCGNYNMNTAQVNT